jgi:hypothetical protein
MSDAGAHARLSVEVRVLCLLGPLLCIAFLFGARVALPFLWSRPELHGLFSRPCLFRELTTIPCPFCGGTRAVFLAARGQWASAARMNPAGAAAVALAPAIGVWLAACAATGHSLGLRRVHRLLNNRRTVYLLVALLLALWMHQLLVARPLLGAERMECPVSTRRAAPG